MTIAAYIITLAAVAITATSLIQAIIGMPFAWVVGPLFGGLIGSLLVWLGIDYLWQWLEGGNIPVAALAGALMVLAVHGGLAKDTLTQQSKWMMGAEMWAIILIGIGLVIYPHAIRWY